MAGAARIAFRLGALLALGQLSCGDGARPAVDASIDDVDAALTDAGPDAAPDAAPDAGRDLDPDGVERLFPGAPGSSFRLGTGNPNSTSNFEIERRTMASPGVDGAFPFWNVVAHDLNYASGGTGKTIRLHIKASGGQQNFTWKTQQGYLSSPADVRNQEFTAFVRPHQIFDQDRAAVTMKIRGGAHTTDGDLGSCVMMTLHPGGRGFVTRFGKELTHPTYDYKTVSPRFQAALVDGAWVGIKMVSYGVPGDATRVVNRLYLDTDPFDRTTGRPRNNWRFFSEYIDVEGLSTGTYSKLADWGGWITTVRTDGLMTLDFALVGVREIVPPSN